jgi:hypothetical protein
MKGGGWCKSVVAFFNGMGGRFQKARSKVKVLRLVTLNLDTFIR